MAQKALFLDRDGIINKDTGYVHRPQDIEFVDGIFDVIRCFVAHGYCPVIVTNQSGIGRGRYSEADFAALSEWMQTQFHANGLPSIPVYFCPHHPTAGQGRYKTDCDCRKPKPGMLLTAVAEQDIDPALSYMIGDSWRDIQAADAAGVEHKIFVSRQAHENPQGIKNVVCVREVSDIISTGILSCLT